MREYENYYYLDSEINVIGSLYPLESMPENFLMLPYFGKYGLSIVNQDNEPKEMMCPSFDLSITPDVFAKVVACPSSNIIKYYQSGQSLGNVTLVNHGYVACDIGTYTRRIEFYKLRLKRRKNETWFFIEGRTGLLLDNSIRNTEIKPRIEELGILNFSIWFNLRDSRIKDVFHDSSYRLLYERLIESEAFNGNYP